MYCGSLWLCDSGGANRLLLSQAKGAERERERLALVAVADARQGTENKEEEG